MLHTNKSDALYCRKVLHRAIVTNCIVIIVTVTQIWTDSSNPELISCYTVYRYHIDPAYPPHYTPQSNCFISTNRLISTAAYKRLNNALNVYGKWAIKGSGWL